MNDEGYADLLREHKVDNQKDLENILKKEIIIGIEGIKKNYPQCKIIIGADGARSPVREMITDKKSEDESVIKIDLRNMIEVKYQVEGKVKPLSKTSFFLTQALLDGFLCLEHVKYQPDKKITEITLRFLVDQETYDDHMLRNVNAKNLLSLHRFIPQKLYHAVNMWLNTRGDKKIVIGSATINKTVLSIYTSRKYAREVQNHLVLLVGDASCGFPFMNGLNLGLKNSTKLVSLVKPEWDLIKENNHDAMKRLISTYAKATTETFGEGSDLVKKANRKIDYQKASVQSVHYTTFPIKASISYHRSNEHEIFSANQLLPLEAICSYSHRIKHTHRQKHVLCEALINKLLECGTDFEKIKKLLHLAYIKNKQIEVFKDNTWSYYFFGSFFIHSMNKPYLTFTEEEIASHQPGDIPEILTSQSGKLSQGLHHLLAHLNQHVLKYEVFQKSKMELEGKSHVGEQRKFQM